MIKKTLFLSLLTINLSAVELRITLTESEINSAYSSLAMPELKELEFQEPLKARLLGLISAKPLNIYEAVFSEVQRSIAHIKNRPQRAKYQRQRDNFIRAILSVLLKDHKESLEQVLKAI
ncbi:hypothetical protein A3F66_02870 [candidate division TM6 bacterium RIFCSPHIGHO2_12_FULL_32_22]|nr:MAG: hypothetical protein A3F66_02870 [candidate division TM6 bacterium RIFCSPHIGHO2_12_FULL_32_22]